MYIEWGERMNRQNNRQKGVMLVFTAIMLPISLSSADWCMTWGYVRTEV